MEKNSKIDWCTNADEGSDVIGTLFVQLPSKFSGGKIGIYKWNEEYQEEASYSTFTLGASGDASYACHCLVHYADCEYEFARIESGARVLLRYGLQHRAPIAKPSAALISQSMIPLRRGLAGLPPVDRMFLVPTEKEYPSSSLMRQGINALSYTHRVNAEAIKSAGSGWKVYILNAQMNYYSTMGPYDDYPYSNKDSRILHIYDEQGTNVTTQMSWVEEIPSLFDCVSPANRTGPAMLLGTQDEEDFYFEGYSDNWGKCTASTSSTGPRNHGGYYGYGSDDGNTTKKVFQATFLLAFDTNVAGTELKCLTGIDGVREVSRKILAMEDTKSKLSFLRRVLDVVDAKEKSKFDVPSCTMMLNMLMNMKRRELDLVKKTMAGLSSSLNPSKELYDTLLTAITRFGHDKLAGSISVFLGNRPQSELSWFLHRADFILKLNKINKIQTNYLSESVRDLAACTKRNVSRSDDVNQIILSMIRQHGVEAMKSVVEASFSYIDKVASRSLLDLLNRAVLLSNLLRFSRYNFLRKSLVEFTKCFVRGITRICDLDRELQEGTAKNAFMRSVRYVCEYAQEDDLERFGDWMISSASLFDAAMKLIADESTDDEACPCIMVHTILNKCLIQSSVRPTSRGPTWTRQWCDYRSQDGTVSKSTHIRKVLKAYPDMGHKTDSDGRLTLHHAVDKSSTSYEAIIDVFEAHPKGASVRDPVSGLFPFMLAASNDNVAAAFSLLLADPSLVVGVTEDVQDDVEGGNKRKRSISMDVVVDDVRM